MIGERARYAAYALSPPGAEAVHRDAPSTDQPPGPVGHWWRRQWWERLRGAGGALVAPAAPGSVVGDLNTTQRFTSGVLWPVGLNAASVIRATPCAPTACPLSCLRGVGACGAAERRLQCVGLRAVVAGTTVRLVAADPQGNPASEVRASDRLRSSPRMKVPGLPGAALSRWRRCSGATGRLYHRGTREFAAAAAEGVLDRLPPRPPPASPWAIAQVESLVGAPTAGASSRPVRRGERRLWARATDCPAACGMDSRMTWIRTAWTASRKFQRVFLARHSAGTVASVSLGVRDLLVRSHCPSGSDVRVWNRIQWPPGNDVPFFEQEYVLETWMKSWLDGDHQQPWLVLRPTPPRRDVPSRGDSRGESGPPRPMDSSRCR
jgi:hypothetical protein